MLVPWVGPRTRRGWTSTERRPFGFGGGALRGVKGSPRAHASFHRASDEAPRREIAAMRKRDAKTSSLPPQRVCLSAPHTHTTQQALAPSVHPSGCKLGFREKWIPWIISIIHGEDLQEPASPGHAEMADDSSSDEGTARDVISIDGDIIPLDEARKLSRKHKCHQRA